MAAGGEGPRTCSECCPALRTRESVPITDPQAGLPNGQPIVESYSGAVQHRPVGCPRRIAVERRVMVGVFVGWAVAAIVLVLATALLGWSVRGSILGLLIDACGRYSLTQLHLVVCTS